MNVSDFKEISGGPQEKIMNSKFLQNEKENQKDQSNLHTKNQQDIVVDNDTLKNKTLEQKFEFYNAQLDQELLNSNYEKALDLATQLFAYARVLHEIYGQDQTFYYRAYLNLIKCYRKNKNFETAEKHIIKAKTAIRKILKNLYEIQEENQEIYKIHVLILKELFLIYAEIGAKEQSSKLNDMLEEENLDIFNFQDKLEYIIGKCEIYEENGQIQDALKSLLQCQETVNQNIDSIEKINLAQYYQKISNFYKQLNDFQQAIQYLQMSIDFLTQEELQYENIQFKIVEIISEKIQIFEFLENCEESLKQEYENLANTVFLFLQAKPGIMITNENIYLQPLMEYANFLFKIQQHEKADEITEQIYQIVKLNYGIFHKNQIAIFKLKSKINLKLGQKKKAVNCIKIAIEICNQTNEKNLKQKFEKRLASILNSN